MALIVNNRTVKDGATPPGTFQIGTLRDTTAGIDWDAAVIFDLESQNWARVDGTTGRLRVEAAPNLPVFVGAQYNLSVGSGANVTLTVPAGATRAFITVDPKNPTVSLGDYLRYTYSGANPSGTIGHTLAPGDADWFTNLSLLELSGDNGGVVLQVTYWHD